MFVVFVVVVVVVVVVFVVVVVVVVVILLLFRTLATGKISVLPNEYFVSVLVVFPKRQF